MAYYYSASNRAFYCSDIVSVDVMPADKVAVTDEAYKALMAAQNAGKLIRPGAGGAPEAVDQPGGAATGITHEVTAATADTLGHVKIGAGVNVTKDGTISVDTEVLFRQDSWSTRIASTLYAVGDIVDCPYKRNLELVCTQAGTTGSGDLAEGGLTHGATVADGSVKWKVRAKIKTVNGGEPDASGEIDVDVGVKTVNGTKPDEEGNVNVDISSKRDHTLQVANVDLNTLLDDKTWACSGTLKNTPIPCTFCIVHAYDTGAPVSGNIVQVCYIPNQTDNTVRTFTRNCLNGSTFGKWTESGAVKTVNSIAPDASGEVTLPNATTSQAGLVRLAAEEDILNEAPQTAVCTQLIYEINEFRRKSTTYQVGDKVDCAFQYERFLECTKAGTTSANLLDTRNVTHGQVIVDGTVEWTVRTHARSVNGAVADANGNVSLNNLSYLPLSGGTMHGRIATDYGNLIGCASDDGYVNIDGGSGFGNGASLTLYGNDHSNNGGAFSLKTGSDGLLYGDGRNLSFNGKVTFEALNMLASSANEGGEIFLMPPPDYGVYGGVKLDSYKNTFRVFNDTNTALSLEFDNTIAWCFGQLLERVADHGSDFIRFNSGLQICWRDYVAGNSTWIFPKAFLANPAVFMTPTGRGSNPGIHYENLTTTSVYFGNGSGWGTSGLAVGRWK